MKNQRKSEIRVGITVIIGIILLLWVIGWTKNFTFDSNEREITINFENVSGLNISDPVLVKGIKQGYVNDIYYSDNSALVEIKLSKNIKLKEDAIISLMVLDLMGGKKVEINPGVLENEMDYAGIQQGLFLGDISTTMAMLGTVQDDLVEVIVEVKNSLNSMNKLLGNGEFTDELMKSITSINQLIYKTDKLIADNSHSINSLIKTSHELVNNSNEFISENRTDVSSAIKNMNSVMSNTDSLIIQLSNFMNDIEKSNNNIGKLVNDETMMEELQITLKQLKELTSIALEQLKGEGFKVDADIF